MTVQSRISKDRRSSSRVVEILDCHFRCGDATYSAVILNLSQKGALLSSRFEVPTGKTVEITVHSEHLNKNLILKGIVERSNGVWTEFGPLKRFVVRFSHTPLELLRLITKLNAKYM